MENAAKPGNQVPVLPKRREARLPVALNVRGFWALTPMASPSIKPGDG